MLNRVNFFDQLLNRVCFFDHLLNRVNFFYHLLNRVTGNFFDHLLNRVIFLYHLLNRVKFFDHLLNRVNFFDHLLNRVIFFYHLLNRVFFFPARQKKQRKEEQTRVPRSLFDRPSAQLLKIRREHKQKSGLLKPFRPVPPPIVKPNADTSDHPEWLIHEDWALLQVSCANHILFNIKLLM